jgi:hypothetical protein
MHVLGGLGISIARCIDCYKGRRQKAREERAREEEEQRKVDLIQASLDAATASKEKRRKTYDYSTSEVSTL